MDCVVDMSQPCQGLHCLRPMGMTKPSPGQASRNARGHPLVHVQALTVCEENVHNSFLLLDDYSPRHLPYREELLLTLSLPPSSAICNTPASLIPICKIHELNF